MPPPMAAWRASPRIACHIGGRTANSLPAGKRPSEPLDVAGQGGVGRDMPRGMIAHNIDNGRTGPLCVVQVGNTVGQARAQMQKGHGRYPLHPRVSVRSTRTDALEESEHRPDCGVASECGRYGQLRRPCIGKTGIDPPAASVFNNISAPFMIYLPTNRRPRATPTQDAFPRKPIAISF